MGEFSKNFANKPYLLSPTTADTDSIFNALEWIMFEIDRRLTTDEPNLDQYPYIITVIEGFSLMIVADSNRFENLLSVILKKAAEVKIHFIISDLKTGPEVFIPLITNLFPTKICFKGSNMQFLQPDKNQAIKIQTNI